MPPREIHHAISLYEGEIASTDAQLASLGRLDPALLVLTSDHGESLGEHGYYFAHGEYLYEGTLLVPLILRWPGHVPAGKVSTRMVRLTDIAPTALAMLGQPLQFRPGLTGTTFRAICEDPRRTERESAGSSPTRTSPTRKTREAMCRESQANGGAFAASATS